MGITWSLLLPSNLRGLPGNEVMVLYESWPPIPGDLGTGNILRPGWRVCFWRARHPTMDMPRLTPLSSFTIHTSTFSQSWSTIRTFLHQQARGPRGHPGTPRGPKNPGFLDQESIPCAWFSASCRAFCGSNAWTATQIFSCREDLQVNLQTSGCPNFPGLILKKRNLELCIPRMTTTSGCLTRSDLIEFASVCLPWFSLLYTLLALCQELGLS